MAAAGGRIQNPKCGGYSGRPSEDTYGVWDPWGACPPLGVPIGALVILWTFRLPAPHTLRRGGVVACPIYRSRIESVLIGTTHRDGKEARPLAGAVGQYPYLNTQFWERQRGGWANESPDPPTLTPWVGASGGMRCCWDNAHQITMISETPAAAPSTRHRWSHRVDGFTGSCDADRTRHEVSIEPLRHGLPCTKIAEMYRLGWLGTQLTLASHFRHRAWSRAQLSHRDPHWIGPDIIPGGGL